MSMSPSWGKFEEKMNSSSNRKVYTQTSFSLLERSKSKEAWYIILNSLSLIGREIKKNTKFSFTEIYTALQSIAIDEYCLFRQLYNSDVIGTYRLSRQV